MNQGEPELRFWNLKDHSVVKTVKLEGFVVGGIKVAVGMHYLILNNRSDTLSLFNSENGKAVFEVARKDFIKDILISKKENELLAVSSVNVLGETYTSIKVYNGTTGRLKITEKHELESFIVLILIE